MKRLLFIPLLSLLVIILPGCWDRKNLEDISFVMMLGLDLDQDNNLLVYNIVPVFSKDAKKKEDTVGVRAISLRESRGKADTFFDGVVTGRKMQIILLGKQLLKHEDWFPLLDVLYRDSKRSVNAVVVFVDDPVSQVINLKFPEKPRLSLFLRHIIDTSSETNKTVETTTRELHRQMFEKGITPAISELKMDKKLQLIGTALLNEKGKYVASLRSQENELLLILQKKVKKDPELTIRLPEMKNRGGGIFHKNVVSFILNDMKNQIKTAYRDGHFQFEFRISSLISLSEREFPFDIEKTSDKLESMIEGQLEKQFEQLIKKIQKHKIDPIGLGLYAPSHQYKEWQKVQDDWGEALSKADIKIKVKVKVKSRGPIK